DLCEAYGKVVDVFIPNRKSKAGKRFAFVRFIRVVDMDRLIGNMCTLWVGRFNLHANVVRYERPIKSSTSKRVTVEKPPSLFNHRPSGYSCEVMSSNEIIGICQLGFGQGHMGRSGRGQGYCSCGGEVHRKGWVRVVCLGGKGC
nr:UvrD-like helicase, ATP-binding domain, P-loop containing nucleoside triphosphate hydrolase [Tanacetum cinerariifolium]